MRALLKALSPGLTVVRQIAPGVGVAAILAVLAKSLADGMAHGMAGLPHLPLSPVLYAVLLGMLWRNTIGVPQWAAEGLTWAMHGLLRTGIALVGLHLTLSGATSIALKALPVSLGCLCVALLTGVAVARMLGVPNRLGTLLAVGTAVCGCTAIIAVSPAVRARHVETAFAITCIVLFGCTAMLLYPWVAQRLFASSPLHAGIFLGTAIHDTSQVIGAALIYSQQFHVPEALAAASVAKLLRNLSIIVLVPAAAWLARRAPEEGSEAGETPERGPRVKTMPFFVFAFIFFVIFRTVGDSVFGSSGGAAQWHALITAGEKASELFLVCGMTAVGLSVSFTDMWRIGWRPLAAGFLLAGTVGVCSLFLTLGVQRLLG